MANQKYDAFLTVARLGSFKAAAEELGFEIEVDESIQAEEKPARRKKDEAPAEAILPRLLRFFTIPRPASATW